MLISDILPYENNARANEGAVRAVAESIREFGLRGTIGLESRERPVIVFGHTRVAACRLLGWEEIPDERVEFCDDLTADQIKAFRIADNKTGSIAHYKPSALREEVRRIGMDMTRFGVEFKSRQRARGAERGRTDRRYLLDKVDAADCVNGMPAMAPTDACPEALQGFNYAKGTPADGKAGVGCHFFIDDYQFERVWSRPERYVGMLRPYGCVICPDFSLYMDMPEPLQRWNRYRSQALGLWWQRQGLSVVPVLSWAQRYTYDFAFGGIPRHATVATSTVGVRRDADALAVWRDGMREAMRRLEPSRVLLYGGNVGFDFGGAEVREYNAGGRFGR